MNTVTVPESVNRFLKLEDAPAFGAGSMSAEQDRTFVLLAQLFPIIVWPWKRKASPAVDAHGKENLNWAITLMIVFFPVGFISGLLGGVISALISGVLALLNIGLLAMLVFAVLKAREGKILRYPFNLRLIK